METCEKANRRVEVLKKAVTLVAAPVLAVPFAAWFVTLACMDVIRSNGGRADCADDHTG